MSALILSEDEIIELTHYRRAFEQLRQLKALGVPAIRLRDNTVRVLRMHLIYPAHAPGAPAAPRPQLKLLKK